MNQYTLELENDQLLNIIPFVAFLKRNEGNAIQIIVNQESHDITTTGVVDLIDQFEFKSVQINTSNSIESHNKYHINNNNWYHWFTNILKFDYSFDYTWKGSKIFGCFYGRPTASRLGIVSYLHNNYPEQFVAKVRFDVNDQDSRKRFEIQKLYEWDQTAINQLSTFLSSIEKYKSETTFHAYEYSTWDYDYSNQLNYLYKDILIDLVAESHLLGNSFYPTEKIVRAILCRKAFIVMSPVNYLGYLRQMGFKTFNKFWDESYDYLTAKDRYFAILELIKKLSQLSPDRLIKLNDELKEITEHNYQLINSRSFTTKITQIRN